MKLTEKKMEKFLRSILMLFICLCASGLLVSCGDDDKEEVVAPEDPEIPYLGAWRFDFDSDDIEILVLDDYSKATIYVTTESLFGNGKYEEKYTGRYRETPGGQSLLITLDEDEFYIDIYGSGDNLYLEADEVRGRRINRASVPTEPGDSSEEPSAKDKLSGTTWMLSSITGWGASSIDEYEGMQFRFGNNGSVTEWYTSEESYSGTYTISGDRISFKYIPFINEWGSSFDFSVSGTRLTLIQDRGESFETSLIFTKVS